MPPSLQSPFVLKKFRLLSIALFLLFPAFIYGQSLTGLWTGTLSNDSTTSRKDQSFEIALTEYNGKVYGYSRSEFIVNDTLYYIVKRVKGTIKGDICEVTDDEIVSYNFIGKLDKGIKLTSTFKKNQSDNNWYLAGTWKTNSTKKYYAVTGKVTLSEEKDLASSKLFPHLEELKLADDIAFYKERKEPAPIIKLALPEKIKTEYNTASINPDRNLTFIEKTELTNVNITTQNSEKTLAYNEVPEKLIERPAIDLPKTDIKKTEPATVNIPAQNSEKTLAYNEVPEKLIERPAIDLPKTDIKKTEPVAVNVKPVISNKTIAKNQLPENTIVQVKEQPLTKFDNSKPSNSQTNNTSTPLPVKNKPVNSEVAAKTEIKKQEPFTQQATRSTAQIVNTNPVQNKPEVSVLKPEEIKKPAVDVIAKAAVVAGRKSEFAQMVSFKSDSLEFSLYDNGEIDGDTVSIYLNGEVILSKQCLKSTAIKKTIHITSANEEFTLVLFAENLGKYPPNTGLLVVHDGEDVYNLRFSADFQKNAGIVFKRKK